MPLVPNKYWYSLRSSQVCHCNWWLVDDGIDRASRSRLTKSGSSSVFFSEWPRNLDLGTGSSKWPTAGMGDETCSPGLCTRGEPVTRDPCFWPFRGCRVDTRNPTRDTERRVSTQPAPVKKMLWRVGWRVFKLPLFLRYGYQSISIMMNEYWNWYVFWLYITI